MMMVEHQQNVELSTEDIYLCDNCDAEFIGLEKMKVHYACPRVHIDYNKEDK